MSYDQPVTADEKRWQAESDANTLAEAQVIADDPKRMQAAKNIADKMANDQADRTKSLRKVAGQSKRPYTEKKVQGTGSGGSIGSPKHKPASGMAEMPVKFLGSP